MAQVELPDGPGEVARAACWLGEINLKVDVQIRAKEAIHANTGLKS
jgi:hypothetical protein